MSNVKMRWLPREGGTAVPEFLADQRQSFDRSFAPGFRRFPPGLKVCGVMRVSVR